MQKKQRHGDLEKKGGGTKTGYEKGKGRREDENERIGRKQENKEALA